MAATTTAARNKNSGSGSGSSMYMSAEALDNLRFYKYSGVDKSLLANWFLKRHWDWCTATFFPVYMAPNLITLCGLVCIVVNLLTVLYYCPNITPCACPPWVYVLSAAGIYAYQIFDNVDGRQARRTGTSSPLGELFDHGCDSLFVPVAGMLMFNCMYLTPWMSWLAFWGVAIPFFMAHWEEFHTGELILGVIANPTEGQLVMCTLLLLSAYLGPLVWTSSVTQLLGFSTPEWLPQVGINHVLMGVLIIGGISVVFVNGSVGLRNVREHNKSLLKSIMLMFPLTAFGLTMSAWFYWSKEAILEQNTTLVIIFAGLEFSYILNRMLIARITRMEYNVWNPVPLLPVVGLVHCVVAPAWSVVSETHLFYGLLALLVVIYVHFTVDVVSTLASHLGIRCFTIPYNVGGKGKQPTHTRSKSKGH